MEKLKLALLETFSFFEPMNKEQIYLQMEPDNLEEVGNSTAEEVDLAIEELVKEKKIKKLRIDKEDRWQKIFKKRPWWSKLKWW